MNDTFMRLQPGDGSPSGMQPSNLVQAEAFTTEDHTELDQLYFATEDEGILTGVWECAPCKEEIDSYPVHEMMTVISGSVTLTNKNGDSETFYCRRRVLYTQGYTMYLAYYREAAEILYDSELIDIAQVLSSFAEFR